ncbi:hypothetical protein ACLBQC_32005, partial [Klebsiella pneumoniae]|uniref:hypothetical protein n=1 Tax=Klebsiella pneumoniae TaxID=573 RepID=UPI0039684D6F
VFAGEIYACDLAPSLADLAEKYPATWNDLKDDYDGFAMVGVNDTIYIFNEEGIDEGYGLSGDLLAEFGVSECADENDP